MIRAIGLGVHSDEHHRRAIRDGRFDCILTYLDYTLLDQSALFLIVEAYHAGIAVAVGTPLATGFLVGRGVPEVEMSVAAAPTPVGTSVWTRLAAAGCSTGWVRLERAGLSGVQTLTGGVVRE